MSKTVLSLIALVPTAVIVNGERQVVQPGQPLPALTPADSTALVGAKAAREATVDPSPVAPADAAASAPAAPDGGGVGAAAVSAPSAAPAPSPAAKTRKR